MNATMHPAAARYLKELERELADLPRPRRREVLSDIREHIDEAAPPGVGDAEVRNVLDALGDARTIGDEARDRFGITKRRGGALEGAAIALLLVGGIVVPGFGWLVGVVLLWVSSVWSVRDKVIGTLVVPGGLALSLYLYFLAPLGVTVCTAEPGPTSGSRLEAVQTCSEEALTGAWWGIALMVLITILPIATAIYLGRRAWAGDRG